MQLHNNNMQYRWLIFISSILLTFTKFLVEVSYGRLIIDLLKTFPTAKMAILQWTGSMVSATESLFVWQVLPLISLFSYKWTVCIGVMLGTVGLVLASISVNEFQLMISYGVLFGYGGVFLINVGLFLVAANFPPDDPYHIFTTSFKLSVYPLAVAAVPISNQMLIMFGWRITYLIYACIIMVLGLAVSVVFGKECYNNNSWQTDNKSTKSNTLPKMAKRKMYIITAFQMAACFFGTMYLNAPIYLLPKHTQQLGFSLHQGTSLVSYFGIAEACTRLATAFLGDRFLKKRLLYVYVVCYGLEAIVNSLLGYTATTYVNLTMYSVAMGALTGPVMAAFYAVCGEMLLGYYTNELFSLSCFAFGIGFLFGMFIEGLTFDLTNSFQDVYLLMSAMQITAATSIVVIILLRRSLQRFLLRRE